MSDSPLGGNGVPSFEYKFLSSLCHEVTFKDGLLLGFRPDDDVGKWATVTLVRKRPPNADRPFQVTICPMRRENLEQLENSGEEHFACWWHGRNYYTAGRLVAFRREGGIAFVDLDWPEEGMLWGTAPCIDQWVIPYPLLYRMFQRRPLSFGALH